MMRIIKIGKAKRKSIVNEVDFFKKRIQKYSKIDIISLTESKNRNNKDVIDEESLRISEKIKSDDYSICLDRAGKNYTSKEFSKLINKIRTNGKKPLFIIGGAFGTSEKLKNSVNLRLSMSDFTMQHDIALIVLLEQIYRSFTILNNHPYHK